MGNWNFWVNHYFPDFPILTYTVYAIKIGMLHGNALTWKRGMDIRQSFMDYWSSCWVPWKIPGLCILIPQKSSYFRLSSLQAFNWGDTLFIPSLSQGIFFFSQISTYILYWQYRAASGMFWVLVLTCKRSFKVMFHFGRKNPQESGFPVEWLPYFYSECNFYW